MANYRGRNQKQYQTAVADQINLSSKKPKKRQWKVKLTPEVDEDDEIEYKEVEYLKAPFDSEKVYQTISEIVDKIFLPTIEEEEDAPPRPYVYNANENVNLCQKLSKEIRDALKLWRNLARYRIIAQVSIVEKNHQGVHMKMKFVVDPKTDNYVSYYLDNPNFYIVVNVILIYQD